MQAQVRQQSERKGQNANRRQNRLLRQRSLTRRVSSLDTAKNADIKAKFHRLADQWISQTEHMSSIKKACMHPSYQRIIGMGSQVIPYLLQELKRNPDHWFWALNAITEEDPAQSEDSFDGAVSAWLKWGKEKGYL
jgi:hypothetical protein